MHIAKEDIVAYKTMLHRDGDLGLLSPYMRYRYYNCKGNIYEAEINPLPTNYLEYGSICIRFGLHCYSADCPYEVITGCEGITDKLIMHSKSDGRPLASLHTRASLPKVWSGSQSQDSCCLMLTSNSRLTNMCPVLMKVIIPAGATYYENNRGEIVTNKLIIKERIA